MDIVHQPLVALSKLAADLDLKMVRMDLEELFNLAFCSAILSDYSEQDRVSLYRSYTALRGLLDQLELDFRQEKA